MSVHKMQLAHFYSSLSMLLHNSQRTHTSSSPSCLLVDTGTSGVVSMRQ